MGYGPINVFILPSKYISEDFPYPMEGNSSGVGKKRVYAKIIIYINGFFGEILPLGDKRKGLQIYEGFFGGKWHKFTIFWGKNKIKSKLNSPYQYHSFWMLLEYTRSKEILLHSLPYRQTWLESYLRRLPIHLPHNFEKQIHDMHFHILQCTKLQWICSNYGD